MSERTLIPISAQPKIGKINEAEYFRLYEKSLADPDAFWGEQGKRLDWIKPYTKVCNASFTGWARSTTTIVASSATIQAWSSAPLAKEKRVSFSIATYRMALAAKNAV